MNRQMRGFTKVTHTEEIPTKTVRMAVIRRLGTYLVRYKFLVLLILTLMLVSNFTALAAPMLSGKAINLLSSGKTMVDLDGVAVYGILMALCYILSGILSYVLTIMTTILSKKIVHTMRAQVFEKLMQLPVSFFDTHATGDIISHISYDIDVVNVSLSHNLLSILTNVITVVGSLIMMLSIAPTLIVVFLFTVPASIWFAKWKTKRTRPFFRKRSQSLGVLNGYAEAMLSGHKTSKAYGRENIIVERFDQKNQEAVDAYYKADLHGSYMGPIINFINNFSISAVAMLGGIFYMLTVTNGATLPIFFHIGLGDVGAFIQYSRKFSGPINEFANILHELQSACAAAERVFRILDLETEKPDEKDAVILKNVKGNVSLEKVRFGYVPQKTVIQELTLDVKAGTTIAIVGPTGSGKTTIINLLMRFYDTDSGVIRLDGKNICHVTRESLRKAYAMVLQDTWLFGGTIFENITYGKENATYHEVLQAAKAAKIHTFIESLPKGYDTVLTDDGTGISKGQKQLITIARAMLSDAPILILDEATSNVDSRTECLIQDAMNSLMKNRTCFVIAHRLSTIQNADKILVFKQGTVIEQGTHDELLRKNGFYASLYNSQFAQ